MLNSKKRWGAGTNWEMSGFNFSDKMVTVGNKTEVQNGGQTEGSVHYLL